MNIIRSYKEEELVAHLKSADAKRFAIVYDYFSPVLFGIIKKIVKHDELAEDILQESFFKIWNSAGSYDQEKSRLFTWILNVSRNTAIDHLRSKQSNIDRSTQPMDYLYNSNSFHNATHIQHEHIGLKNVVGNLKEDQTEIINLVFFEGYTQSEIAHKLNMPLGTVKTKCRTALQILRRTLSDQN